MITGKRILTNTIALTVGKGFSDLCVFFFLVYFARAFGASILGKYSFAMSVGGLLTVLINLGLNTVMVREVSRNRKLEPSFVGNFMLIQSIFAVIVWALIFLIAQLLHNDSEAKTILIIIGTYHIFLRLSSFFEAQFSVHEELYYSAFLLLLHRLIILVLGISIIILWNNPLLTLSVYPVSGFIMFALGLTISVSRYGWPSFRLNIAFIRKSLVNALPFLILIALGQLYDRTGIILLSIFSGEEATGIYAAPDRLIVTITAGLGMFGMVILPVMSRLSIQSEDKFFRLYEGCVRLMFVLVLPITMLIFLLSHKIILLIFGAEFQASVDILRILSFSLLFSGLNHIFVGFLIANNKHQKLVQYQTLVVVIHMMLCVGLILGLEFIGLAYAKLFSSFLLSMIAFWFISIKIYGISIIRPIAVSIVSCVVAGLVFNLMNGFELWIATFCTILLLVASLFFLGGVERNDLMYLKKVFWRQPS